MDAANTTIILGLTLDELKLWIPSVISIITLLVNLIFYIFIQPGLGYKFQSKERLAKISAEYFEYLAKVVSLTDFSGALTEIRSHSQRIHVCFKAGEPDPVTKKQLEEIYQLVKKRKEMTDSLEIKQWENEFRNKQKELRASLGAYCGGIEKKWWKR